MHYNPAPRLRAGFWVNSGGPARWPSAEAGLGTLVLLLVSLPYLLVLSNLTELKSLAGLWDHRTLGLLGAGLKLSAWVTVSAVLLAILVLLLLGFTPASRLRWLLLIGIGLTFCIPPVVHLSAWQALTLKAGFPPLLNAVVVLTWSAFPLAVGLLLLGLLNFNPASLEAGLLYGDSYGVCRYLLPPPLLPSLFTAMVIIFLLTFIQSEVPSLVGYPVYADEFLARLVLEPSAAGAVGLALPQFAAVLVTIPLLLRLERGLLAQSWQTGGPRRLATLWPTARVASWITFGFLGLLLMPFFSLLWRARFTGLIAAHGAALANSLTLGMLSAGLAVALAHLGADALITVNAAWRAVLLTLVLLQFLLPGPLLGLGMLKLANGLPWLKQGDLLLILTHALRIFPLLALLLAGWRLPRAGAYRNEIELLGITWWRRQWRLRLSQERVSLGFAAGLGLALALAELPTTVLVVAPGAETAVLRLYNLMHYGDWAGVAALALVEALLIGGSLLLAGVIVWKWHAPR